jgi:hypothetical protein
MIYKEGLSFIKRFVGCLLERLCDLLIVGKVFVLERAIGIITLRVRKAARKAGLIWYL